MDINKENTKYLASLLANCGATQDEINDLSFDDEVGIFESNRLADWFVSQINFGWRVWQAAKAQAVPEGFVVVPREPYAYLIKHKLWKKDSDPEIFLAVDFLGDDGVEKDKLVVCKPLYLGDDEAQEQVG